MTQPSPDNEVNERILARYFKVASIKVAWANPLRQLIVTMFNRQLAALQSE